MIECPSTALACVLDTLARGYRTAIAHNRHQQLAILKLGHIGHQGGIVHGHEGIAARGALPRQMILVIDHVADRAAKAVVIAAHTLHARNRALVGCSESFTTGVHGSASLARRAESLYTPPSAG